MKIKYLYITGSIKELRMVETYVYKDNNLRTNSEYPFLLIYVITCNFIT